MVSLSRSFKLWAVASLVSPSFAALYTSPSQLPQTTFDYVVIGGGTAGLVVANRLTEVSNVTVLVLEAGGSNENVTAAIIPLLGPSLTPNTPFDWNYTTTAQPGYNGRSLPYARGRILGGSSSVNYMVYTRGSKDDFDRYARMSGDDGWSWDSIKSVFPRHEKFAKPADSHDTAGDFTTSAHGTDGILEVSLPGFATPVDQRVLDATKEFPDEFPFNEDHNAGNVLGISWSQATIGNPPIRSSSATAYLASKYLSRPNLHVLINAQVTKIVKTGEVSGLPSFHAVEFATKSGEPVTTVNANKEIILSAGSIGTPIILLLSGIGPAEELKALGINSTLDNPSVGKNLTDHPLLASTYSVKGDGSFDHIFRGDNISTAIGEWMEKKTGPLVDGVTNHIGFFRFPDNKTTEVFKTSGGDPSAGPKAAHMEMIFSNLWVQPGIPAPANGSFLTLTVTIMSPTSRGSVTLASSDPFAKPIINPNFLATEWDIFGTRESVKLGKRFLSASSFKDYIIAPFGEFAKAGTDKEIEDYARNHAATFFHPVSTASLSPVGAKWGVVDPDLKVKGAEGLRIVDGSVIPYLPNAHTVGPIYLFAERGSDLIKQSNTVFGVSGTNSTDNGTKTDAASSISLGGSSFGLISALASALLATVLSIMF